MIRPGSFGADVGAVYRAAFDAAGGDDAGRAHEVGLKALDAWGWSRWLQVLGALEAISTASDLSAARNIALSALEVSAGAGGRGPELIPTPEEEET